MIGAGENMPKGERPSWQIKLGEGIKLARKSKGWTQEKLAQELGYKDSESISSIESGAKPPTTDVLRRIVTLLGADFTFDGCRICAEALPQPSAPPTSEEVPFDLRQGLLFRGAVVEVTATQKELTIRATVAA